VVGFDGPPVAGGAARGPRRREWPLQTDGCADDPEPKCGCGTPRARASAGVTAGAWVCDDSFISFRYVRQFSRGLGLVFNPGERVEGYSHFLWVILLAALHRTGLDLVTLGRDLPIVFFAGTLALLFVRSLRRAHTALAFLPVAAWGTALHRDMQIWGSGGLETAAFTFCVTAAVLAATSRRVRPGGVAALAALATLFRPEGLLVSACIAGDVGWRRGGRSLGRFAGVWAALVVPLFIWRRIYYHDWLPNTYYAKSASVADWGQGWRYVSLYFQVYPILIVALAAVIVGAVRALRRRRDDPVLLEGVVVFGFLLYVLRLGGDFMFARFLIPVTPLLYLVLEDTILRQRVSVRIAGVVLVVAGTLAATPLRDRLFLQEIGVDGIVDEHRFYPPSITHERRRQGLEIASILHGLPVRVCMLGSQASFCYFADFPYVLEKYGLTDRELAHRKLEQRGRPGHEKAATDEDLIARRIHFVFRGSATKQSNDVFDVVFGDLLASVVVYDRAVMDSLRDRPGVRFVDYPAYVDEFIRKAGKSTPADRQRAWEFFERYYFAHNDDPEREARARAALAPPDSTSP
jgi:hypothetical protein